MNITTKILILLGLLTTSAAWGIGSYAEKDTLYVMTISGLKLKKEPKLTSGTKGVLPYGTEVVVTKLTTAHEDVEEFSGYTIKGSWVEVSTPKGKGYVFDGYLTSFYAPLLTSSSQQGEGIEDYIQSRYIAASKRLPASKNPLEFNQVFSQGIKLAKRVANDSTDYGRIMIEEISLEEIYLITNVLCRTAAKEYPGYNKENALSIEINDNELTITPASGKGLAVKAVVQNARDGGGAVIQYKFLTGNNEPSSEE